MRQFFVFFAHEKKPFETFGTHIECEAVHVQQFSVFFKLEKVSFEVGADVLGFIHVFSRPELAAYNSF